MRILDAVQTRRLRQLDDCRRVAHEQAIWMGFAYHDPKKLPAFKPLAATPAAASAAARSPQADATDYERVRGFFMTLAQGNAQ